MATPSSRTGRSVTHAAGAITEIDSVTVKRALSIVAAFVGLMTIAVAGLAAVSKAEDWMTKRQPSGPPPPSGYGFTPIYTPAGNGRRDLHSPPTWLRFSKSHFKT
jgi:hypothetical protein